MDTDGTRRVAAAQDGPAGTAPLAALIPPAAVPAGRPRPMRAAPRCPAFPWLAWRAFVWSCVRRAVCPRHRRTLPTLAAPPALHSFSTPFRGCRAWRSGPPRPLRTHGNRLAPSIPSSELRLPRRCDPGASVAGRLRRGDAGAPRRGLKHRHKKRMASAMPAQLAAPSLCASVATTTATSMPA